MHSYIREENLWSCFFKRSFEGIHIESDNTIKDNILIYGVSAILAFYKTQNDLTLGTESPGRLLRLWNSDQIDGDKASLFFLWTYAYS